LEDTLACGDSLINKKAKSKLMVGGDWNHNIMHLMSMAKQKKDWREQQAVSSVFLLAHGLKVSCPTAMLRTEFLAGTHVTSSPFSRIPLR
jgi:pyruvate/2-oxoglutarate/acetoin dehydrogenase E1 component